MIRMPPADCLLIGWSGTFPPQTNSISEGSAPKGVHGTNDFRKSGYKGPCPPPGTHRYSFKIFALDRELDLRSRAKRGQVDTR